MGGWLLSLMLGAMVGCGGSTSSEPPATLGPPMRDPIRISMAALHAAGGVPDGWMLTPPQGDVERGRKRFEDYGCQSCHVVQGETFAGSATDESQGPDLTGMGRHHPPAYFVEAILSPSAVITSDGAPDAASDRTAVLSTMPTYPDMSLVELADLVAFLGSLNEGGTHDHAAMMVAAAERATGKGVRPAAPEQPATVFFVQRYDVLSGQLDDFEAWFATEGRDVLLSFDGLASIDTYVHERDRPALTTVFGFRDRQALDTFMNDPRSEQVGLEFDAHIGPHGHGIFTRPPVYRAPSLSK